MLHETRKFRETVRFSQRIGARPPRTSGLSEATTNLRMALWNALYEVALPAVDTRIGYAELNARSRAIWIHVGWRVDTIGDSSPEFLRGILSKHWFSCEWPEFFDLLEFLARLIAPSDGNREGNVFIPLNGILEREGCAYRFVAEELAPLTNQTEMDAVTAAAESAIPAVAQHIRDSLRFLPPAANASPRNSIKESISAVEAALKNLTGQPSATLTEGLKAFEAKNGALHASLRSGLIKLYGYTSDEGGVRHALVDEASNVNVDDARFMIVACSAFSNYLVALSSGIKRKS